MLTFLSAVDATDNAEAMFRKQEDLDKTIGNGNTEEKTESLQTYADQLLQSEHYPMQDIIQKKGDVLELKEALIEK